MQEDQNNNQINGLSDDNSQMSWGYYGQYYSSPSLNKGQKIAVVVLAFFSFFVIIIWMIQFKQSISAPLGSSEKVDTEASAVDSEEVARVDMTKDTDGDGLTDYNELNTYKTSPYLDDSDSDGFNDGMEVRGNKDPNCPTGADCDVVVPENNQEVVDNSQGDNSQGDDSQDDNSVGSVETSVPKSVDKQKSVNQIQSSLTQTQNANLVVPANANRADLQKVLSGQVDSATLRALLVQSGMNKAVLDEISDEELMTNYKEVLAK